MVCNILRSQEFQCNELNFVVHTNVVLFLRAMFNYVLKVGGVLTQKKPKKPVATPKSANWHWLFLVFFGFFWFFKISKLALVFFGFFWFFLVFFGFFWHWFWPEFEIGNWFFLVFFGFFWFFFGFFLA